MGSGGFVQTLRCYTAIVKRIVITCSHGASYTQGIHGAAAWSLITFLSGRLNARITALAINAMPAGSRPIDSFTYTESDGNGGIASATLIITVVHPRVVTASNVTASAASGEKSSARVAP